MAPELKPGGSWTPATLAFAAGGCSSCETQEGVLDDWADIVTAARGANCPVAECIVVGRSLCRERLRCELGGDVDVGSLEAAHSSHVASPALGNLRLIATPL